MPHRASQVVLVVKNPPANAGDIRDSGSIPGPGKNPRRRADNLVQYSCLENLMDRGAWRATVYRVAKSWTRLKQLSTHTHTHTHKFILEQGDGIVLQRKPRVFSKSLVLFR